MGGGGGAWSMERNLKYYNKLSINRVPTQVLQSLIKSYICFFICKALQSLIFGVFFIQKVV